MEVASNFPGQYIPADQDGLGWWGYLFENLKGRMEIYLRGAWERNIQRNTVFNHHMHNAVKWPNML